MKKLIEKRAATDTVDYLSLAVTTCGVGYLPLAPGTWGSLVGVAIYVAAQSIYTAIADKFSGRQSFDLWTTAIVATIFTVFSLIGIWAAGRSMELLGDADPPAAVIDEVIGQLLTFMFVPFAAVSWPVIAAGFLLFRLFDIVKPYPIDDLQDLPGGLGVCADDMLAGIYAGICLSIFNAVSVSV